MKRNVERHKSKLTNKNNLQAILDDLTKLKLSYNKAKFDVGCKLFLEKWIPLEPIMSQYIDDQWIKHNMNWYNGTVVRTPTDNNGIECFNGKMKLYDTEFKRTGLNEFKEKMIEIVSSRSKEYFMDKKAYTMNATIPPPTLKRGFQYSTIKKVFDRELNGGKVECFMRKGDSPDAISENDINAFLIASFNTFDDFVEHMFDLYIIVFDNITDNWQNAACTCPEFANHFICKLALYTS